MLESDMSEDLLKNTKKVLINKREVKFHMVNKTIIFDEPISMQGGDRVEIEWVFSDDGTQVAKSVFICS